MFVEAVPPHHLPDHHAVLGRVGNVLHFHGLAGVGVIGEAEGSDPVEPAVPQNLDDLVADQDESLHQAMARGPGFAGVEGPIEIVEDLDVSAVDRFPLQLKLPGRRPLLSGQRRADVLGACPVLLLKFNNLSAESLVFGANGVVPVHGLLKLRLGQTRLGPVVFGGRRGLLVRVWRAWIVF